MPLPVLLTHTSSFWVSAGCPAALEGWFEAEGVRPGAPVEARRWPRRGAGEDVQRPPRCSVRLLNHRKNSFPAPDGDHIVP